MNVLIDKKTALDNKIKELVEEFTQEFKCGYKATVETIKTTERVGNENFIIGIHTEINSVITS